MSHARSSAREIAKDAIARGDVTGWFEQLYVESERDGFAISWVDLAPNPYLVTWLGKQPAPPRGRAAVVGCGYGDDAELLARAGLDVTAFDVAPSAVARCRSRFPESRVRYEIADALWPPDEWLAAFDFVFEAYYDPGAPRRVAHRLRQIHRIHGRAERKASGRCPQSVGCRSAWNHAVAADTPRARSLRRPRLEPRLARGDPRTRRSPRAAVRRRIRRG